MALKKNTKITKVLLLAFLFSGVMWLPGVVWALSYDNSTGNYQMSDSIKVSGVPSGLGAVAIYETKSGMLLLNTYTEDTTYAMSADYFGVGDFVLINTNDPDQCAQLTLSECRSNPDYIGEIAFSIRAPASTSIISSFIDSLLP